MSKQVHNKQLRLIDLVYIQILYIYEIRLMIMMV